MTNISQLVSTAGKCVLVVVVVCVCVLGLGGRESVTVTHAQ